jgi:molybdenum cofactor cytidylyltransferase
MIHAILLAAGESRRMGRPKALLPYQRDTFLGHIVSVLKTSAVDGITVVLGAHAEVIRSSVDLQGINIVINRDYSQGQLSSLIAALQDLPEDTDAVLLCLVDNPFLTNEIVSMIITQYLESRSSIIVPVFEGKRGHPTLFSKRVFPDLMNTPLDQGARSVLHSRRDEVLELAVPDSGILIRIDTPEDYRRHFGAGI